MIKGVRLFSWLHESAVRVGCKAVVPYLMPNALPAPPVVGF